MAHPHPTLINLPQPPSNPDTPSEAPGTPNSTTTSLSALSTTAIKDGHRGHTLPTTSHRGGHQQNASQNSLEAERADRISRLAGLSSVSQLRAPPSGDSQPPAHSPQTTPTSVTFPQSVNRPVAPQVLGVPAYFDSNGQPVAVTKMSTSGTASATESDVDMMSTNTSFGRETEVDSASGYVGAAHTDRTADMDIDEDNMTNRSVGQFDHDRDRDQEQEQDGDNMSDDGSASLVGFGEGANSTISGPIYVRRPLPGNLTERTSSGLSATAAAAARFDRDETPGSGSITADDDFPDSTNPVPVSGGNYQPGQTSSLRETQHGAQHTRHHYNHQQPPTAREAAERAMRERGLDYASRPGGSPISSPGKRLTFEDQK